MTREQSAERLRQAQDIGYQAFQKKLIPGKENILGVRMPVLRRLAREIVREDWRAWLDDPAPDQWYEETVMRGIVIATAPMEQTERFTRTADFVPRIDNWAVCDCVCASFDLTDRAAWWEFIQPYLHSTEEFPARFGAVMVLELFQGEEDLMRTLAALVGVPAEGYNARMGVAWALSMCGVRFPEQTLDFLERADLDIWTHRKTLQKMLESRRLTGKSRTQTQQKRENLQHRRAGTGGEVRGRKRSEKGK